MTTIDIYKARGTDIALHAVREAIRKLLLECTPAQQDFFKRLYPQGIDSLSLPALSNALDQCQRTIRRNEAVDACVNKDHE